MLIFFIALGVVGLGLGYVFWLLMNEKKSGGDFAERIDPMEVSADELLAEGSPDLSVPLPEKSIPAQKGLFGKFVSKKNKQLAENIPEDFSKEPKPKGFGGLLNKIGLGKLNFGKLSALDLEVPTPTSMPSLKEVMEIERKKKEAASKSPKSQDSPIPDPETAGTASITTGAEETKDSAINPNAEEQLSEKEEGKIDAEINVSLQMDELKEKYARIEKMLTEKSTALEKSEQALKTEKSTQKEFNKVKDILEKELKETKDNSRKIQNELNTSKSEADGYKKHIEQLEQKATKLEKEIAQKESEIDTLVKKPQTFASPGTASTPPVPEKPAQPKKESSPPPAPPEPLAQTPEPAEPEEQTPTPPPESSPPAKPKIDLILPVAAEEPIIELMPADESPPVKPSAPDLDLSANNTSEPETETETEFLSLKPDIISGTPQDKQPEPLKPQDPENPPDTNDAPEEPENKQE